VDGVLETLRAVPSRASPGPPHSGRTPARASRAAVVAEDRAVRAVERHRQAAPRAADAASAAPQKSDDANPGVEEEDRLTPAAERVLEEVDEAAREQRDALHRLRLLDHVHDLDPRHLAAPARRGSESSVNSPVRAASQVSRHGVAEPRRRRPVRRARSTATSRAWYRGADCCLKRGLVLLVHDDEPQRGTARRRRTAAR